jgi:hypothetical protein
VARRDDVLRVPAAALRFKPDATVLAEYAQGVTPASGAPGRTVWLLKDRAIVPVPVTAGASDGTYTEVAGAPFAEGALVVTRATMASASSSTPSSATAGNPLLPTRPGFGR